jgi:hypothetical protein
MRGAAKEWPTSSPDESQKPGASRAGLLAVQADAAGDRRSARRWRDSTASCCWQHNAYQRAQVSWTTSSVSEPRQPARPSRTASMSRVMAGPAEGVLTRAPAAEIPIPLCPRARRAAFFPGPVTPGGPPSGDTCDPEPQHVSLDTWHPAAGALTMLLCLVKGFA